MNIEFLPHSESERPDSLSLLGMPPATLAKYHKKGITTITQLSYLFRPCRRARTLPVSGRYPYELKALAIREQKTYVLHKPELPATPVSIYLDMEGLPDENFIYLIGGLITQPNLPDQTFSFWANQPQEQPLIFDQLKKVVVEYPDATIYHYGSYERKAMKTSGLFMADDRLTNLLAYLRTHVFPPTYGNGLKEVAKYIGFEWTDPDSGGLKSIDWRKSWEATRDQSWKDRLIQYNLDDCLALKKVKEWFDSLIPTEIKKYSPYKFDRNPEFGADFNAITKAAYFDYQRTRIYFRDKNAPVKPNPKIKHLGRGHVIWQPKKANEVVVLPYRTACPYCGPKKLYHSEKKQSFKQTDLKFTPSGIKRWVTEFQSGKGKCAKCLKKHNDAVLRRVHFGDNLFAWAVNLYVNYHISHERISRLLEETFGIYANRLYFMQRKEKWFEQFAPELTRIREDLLRSPVVHIDETQIRLTKGTGYVWILATTDTVCYHFTPTRETHFLKDWLLDYGGTIVTDFYPGYEALPFRQQKCLIHLIRDLNDELFKNPFDHEFKSLVVAFGQLLRSIISTIDRYGLKKRHLAKHVRETQAFHHQFVDRDYTSDLASKAAKRLRKHGDECWTFLHHDGVPWNNNNAEAAVKAFAQHRRTVDGIVTETRLPAYLQMLSLAQTCRYRNISFLDVLRRKHTIK